MSTPVPGRFHAPLMLTLVFVLGAPTVSAQTGVDQSALERQLRGASRTERLEAAHATLSIPAADVATDLRSALIAALEQEGELHARRRRGEVPRPEAPELIARLALSVSRFDDPRAIQGLAGALGTSPPATSALGEFGEGAAHAVISVVCSGEGNTSQVTDGLIALRFMAERSDVNALSPPTVEELRRVAEQRMTGVQPVVVLWRAIDLAVALDTPDLRRIVETIASDRGAVTARGVTDPDLIERTQKRAADRLAGVPPSPRWSGAPPVPGGGIR